MLPNNAVFTIITKPGSTVVLAMDWQDFKAMAQQQTAVLQWTTANDDNIIRWDIERSSNSIDFTPVGSLPARRSADAGACSYHEQPGSGTWYYRIRATSQEGHVGFSPVRSVLITGASIEFLRLRSNPIVGGRLLLDISLPEAHATMVRIVDRQGKPMFQRQYPLSQGSNLVTIDAGYYPAGLYFIQAKAGAENKTLSFLK